MQMIFKNLPRLRQMLLFFLAPVLLVNSSCNEEPVKIDDAVITTSLGKNGGQDVDIFTGQKTIIDLDAIESRWKDLDHIQVMTAIQTIENMETEIAILCTDYVGGCTESQALFVNDVVRTLEMIRQAGANPEH